MCARRTPAGHLLGAAERVDCAEAVATLTAAPARAVGVSDLGVLREGAIADFVVVDPKVSSAPFASDGVRLTMQGGEVVWQR